MGSVGYAEDELVGLRVVRGPDWKYGPQDGGKGFVGTVIKIDKKNSNLVYVRWDSGIQANYRAGDQIDSSDLRILDNSLVGVRHPGVKCRGCGQKDIAGLRWQCLDCPTPIDLCTFCLTNRKHNKIHVNFKRYDRPSSVPVNVVVKIEPKVQLKGIFLGAEVKRGIDWIYNDEDGIQEQGSNHPIGKVVPAPAGREVTPGKVWVQWPDEEDKSYSYRVGFNGKTDLGIVKAGNGGYYQPDTLPVLKISKPKANKDLPFVIGDTVKFTVGLEELREMSVNCNLRWKAGVMKKIVNMVGTITKEDQTDNTVHVVFIENGTSAWFPVKAMRRLVPWLPVGALVQVIDESLSNVNIINATSKSMPDDENVKEGKKKEKEMKMVSDFGRVKLVRPCGEIVMLEFLKPDGRVVIKPFLVNQLKVVNVSVNETMESVRRDLAILLLSEIKKGATLSVQYLMKNFGNMIDCINSRLNDTSYIAFKEACQKGNMEIVKLLLEHKETWIDKEEGDELMECSAGPIHNSVIGNQPEVLRLLLESGYDINYKDPDNETPLHWAVNSRHRECLQILLENQKCDPNLKNKTGETPLKLAVKDSHQCVEMLNIFHDIGKLNLTNKANEDIVYLATKHNNFEAVKFFMSLPEGRELARNSGGVLTETALHASCRLGHNQIANLLVEQLDKDENGKPWGIDIQESVEKKTPLMEVIQKSNCELIETLIGAGANLHATTTKGEAAFHYVARLVHQEELPAVNRPSRATSPAIFDIYTKLKKKHHNEDLCVVTAIVLYIVEKGGIPHNLTFPEIKELIGHNFVYDEITEICPDLNSITQIENNEDNQLRFFLIDDLHESNGKFTESSNLQKKLEFFSNSVAHEKELHHPDSTSSTQQRNSCDLSVPLSQSLNEVTVLTSQNDASPFQDEMATGDPISPIPQHPPSPSSQQQSNVSGSIPPIPNENVPDTMTPTRDTVGNIIAATSGGNNLTPNSDNIGFIMATTDVPHMGETPKNQSVSNNDQHIVNISPVDPFPSDCWSTEEVTMITCTIEKKRIRRRKGKPVEDKFSWIIIDESRRRYSRQKRDVSDIFQCTANFSKKRKCKGTIYVQDLAGKLEEWKANNEKKFTFTVRNAHEEHLPSKRGRQSTDTDSDAPSTSNQKMDAPYMGETIISEGSMSNDQPTADTPTANPVAAGSARPTEEVTRTIEEKQFRKRTRGSGDNKKNLEQNPKSPRERLPRKRGRQSTETESNVPSTSKKKKKTECEKR